MAKPFFSGNYGSALARVDTRPIMEAGRAQGQSFQAIGGMIKEYGLNKEKRQKEEDAAMGNLMGLSPESLSQLKSRNPKIEGAVDKLINGTGGKREVDLINSSVAPFIAGQARADKEEDRKIATQQSLINQKLLQQEFDAKKKLQDLEGTQQTQKEKAFKGLIARADEVKELIKSGEIEYDNVNSNMKRIINDYDLLLNRQVNPFEYAYSTDAESQAELDKLEAEETKLDIKGKELELTEKTEEAAKMPEFADKTSALESVKDLPQGVSASFKKFKDGFDVELQYKAKEFTDIPSVPGFPNYKIVGGYVYEADPKTKKLTKLGSENFGEKSELLQKTIESLTTKEVEQYALAKFRAKEQNDDGDYMVEVDGETIPIPFNQGLENRLIYLDGLQNKLKTQIDYDLTTQ